MSAVTTVDKMASPAPRELCILEETGVACTVRNRETERRRCRDLAPATADSLRDKCRSCACRRREESAELSEPVTHEYAPAKSITCHSEVVIAPTASWTAGRAANLRLDQNAQLNSTGSENVQNFSTELNSLKFAALSRVEFELGWTI